jgi:hypothetical protein
MGEPKFSDAPCYGKEFDARSKVCRVCLANTSCQRRFYKRLGASKPEAISPGFSAPLWNKHVRTRADAVKPMLPEAA